MARRKTREDRSSSVSIASDSRETINNEIESVNDEIVELYKKLSQKERELCKEEMRIAIENNREECMKRSFFQVKPRKVLKNKMCEGSIETDIKIITKML